jgi:3D (Asp-Asp-Asp) domain-containing protein
MLATFAHTFCVLVAFIGASFHTGGGGREPGSQPVAGVIANSGESRIEASESTSTKKIRREFRVTAYCDRGLTAAGVQSGVGQCAAPADIPLGSRIYIPELNRTLIVTDRTHKRFRHNTIDVFIPDRQACIQFGRKQLTAEVTLPDQPHRYGSAKILDDVARLDS